ncbi:hypothetical protein ACGY1D_07480 [Burkholderia pseudomallei]|uniref:hypothetical protein n=1 Tax=Burkholderia pseudomallei TaxID=28450 RepID=UPI001F09B1C6|nr:hypothetical protein [Burkholderia pseudomallei]
MAMTVDTLARADSTTEEVQASAPSLPLDGFSRWCTVRVFIPISHEQARLLEIARRFPSRVRISTGVSAWPNRELHRWIADPSGYRAPVSDLEPVIGRKRSATVPVTPPNSAEEDAESAARRRRFEQLHAADKARKAAAKGSAKTVGAPKRDMRTTTPEDRERKPEQGTPKRPRTAKAKQRVEAV